MNLVFANVLRFRSFSEVAIQKYDFPTELLRVLHILFGVAAVVCNTVKSFPEVYLNSISNCTLAVQYSALVPDGIVFHRSYNVAEQRILWFYGNYAI